MRHERPRRRAARDRMHHRRLDLEVAARDEELADRLHDLRALDEHVARRRVGDQVDVALAVAAAPGRSGRGTSPAAGAATSTAAAPTSHLTDSSPVLVLNSVPVAPTMSPRSQCLNASSALGADAVERHVELDAARSCPAASRSTPCPSRASASCGRPRRRGSPAARASRWASRRAARAGRRRARRGGSRSERPAPRAQLRELRAPLGDDLVLVLGGRSRGGGLGHAGTLQAVPAGAEARLARSMAGSIEWRGARPRSSAIAASTCGPARRLTARFGGERHWTPCFRLAAMKSSRSPSSTRCVLPTSWLVRRSLMRDWSST